MTTKNTINPTAAQRLAAYAAAYKVNPDLCTVDDSLVTDDGITCWVVTKAECKDAGLWFSGDDTHKVNGITWVIFPV